MSSKSKSQDFADQLKSVKIKWRMNKESIKSIESIKRDETRLHAAFVSRTYFGFSDSAVYWAVNQDDGKTCLLDP